MSGAYVMHGRDMCTGIRLENWKDYYMHKTENWYKDTTRENTTQYSDSFPRHRDVTSTCDIDLLITCSITPQLVLSQPSTSEHTT